MFTPGRVCACILQYKLGGVLNANCGPGKEKKTGRLEGFNQERWYLDGCETGFCAKVLVLQRGKGTYSLSLFQ